MTEESVRLNGKEASDYDALLERMPELEECRGIRVDRILPKYDRKERLLTIYCEVHPVTGKKLKHNIDLIPVVSDQNDRIVDRNHVILRKEDFYGFDVMELGLYGLSPAMWMKSGKARVYPAAW